MNTQITREINLSPRLVELVTALQADIKVLQDQIKAKTDQLGTTLSGVCLQEGIDFTKNGVELNADFTTISVYDLPVAKEESSTESKKKK